MTCLDVSRVSGGSKLPYVPKALRGNGTHARDGMWDMPPSGRLRDPESVPQTVDCGNVCSINARFRGVDAAASPMRIESVWSGNGRRCHPPRALLPQLPEKNVKHYPPQVLTLDRHRAQERVDTFFDGQAARMLDYNRAIIPTTETQQIASIIDDLEESFHEPGSTVVGINNRFAEPAKSGYRDLKFLVQDKKSGHVSTTRVVHVGLEEDTFFPMLQSFWAIRSIIARSIMRQHAYSGPAVLVSENFLKDDLDSCFMITGFPDRSWASRYAVARLKDNLRSLRGISTSTDHLRMNWIFLGEDLAIIDGNANDTFISPHLYALIVEMSIDDTDNYLRMEESFSLKKLPIPRDA